MPLTSIPEAVKDQAPAKKASASIVAYEKAKDDAKKKKALEDAAKHAAEIEADDLDDDTKKELAKFQQGLKGELIGLSKEVTTQKPTPKEDGKDDKIETPKPVEASKPVPTPETPPTPYIDPGPATSPDINFTWSFWGGLKKIYDDFNHREIAGNRLSGGGLKDIVENPATVLVKDAVDGVAKTVTPEVKGDTGFAGVVNDVVHYLNPMTWVGESKK